MKINKRNRAFTIVELIVGMVITLLVLGGVVSMLRSGLDLFFKADANGKVTNGVRFTVDTFDRVISPLLASATEVEILAESSDIPTIINSDSDHYIYLSGDQVMHRIKDDDKPLEGSEYIKSILFSMTKTSKDVAKDWIVSVDIAGQVPTYTAAKVSVSMDRMIMNFSKKSGANNTVEGDIYKGHVLHFVAADFDLILQNLKILSSDEKGDDLSNKDNVNKGISLFASYDLHPSDAPDYQLKDRSEIKWYISGLASAALNSSSVAAAETGFELPAYGEPREGHYWLLVDSANNILSGDTLPTDGVFYVRTPSGAVKWGNYGIIKYYIKSAVSNVDGTNKKTGPEAAGPYAAIVKYNSQKVGQKLWSEWMKSVADKLRGGSGSQGFINPAVSDVAMHVDYVEGDSYLTLTLSGGSKPSVTVAANSADLMADEINAAIEDSDPEKRSYTTITNFSLIVDAQIGSNAQDWGYGVLLNGASESATDSGFKDNGYMFQYDRGADGYPVRLYANGKYSRGDTVRNLNSDYFSYGLVIADADVNNSKSGYHNGYISGYRNGYGPYYGPGYLKNDIMQFDSNINDMGNIPLWTQRRRILLTVLEYYDKDKGPAYPRFIIRLKLLKNYSDITYSDDDPWSIGPNSFYSEPAWYGDFVGSSADVTYKSSIKTKYEIKLAYWNGWRWAGSYWVTVDKDKYNEYPDASKDNYYPYGWIGYYYYYVIDRRTTDTPVTVADKIYYTVFDHGANSGKTKDLTSIPSPNERDKYLTRSTWGATDSTSDVAAAIFQHSLMDVRTDISNGMSKNTDTIGFEAADKTIGNNVFSSPKRERYVGLRLWNTNSKSQIFSVNYAPGFSKAELQAIMPAGAKMYEINDGYTVNGATIKNGTGEPKVLKSNNDYEYVQQDHLNKGLFGTDDNSYSDGQGNGSKKIGVMAIQHLKVTTNKGNCGCPMDDKWGAK